MYKRRRQPPKAELFSFDSFLDIVANVVGIILRLILVAWAGARTYKGEALEIPFMTPVGQVAPVAAGQPPSDPFIDRIRQEEGKLVQARSLLTRRLEELTDTRQQREALEKTAAQRQAEMEKLEREKMALAAVNVPEAPADPDEPLPEPFKPSNDLADLTGRISKARDQIEFLGKTTKPGQVHRWRTPISQTVQSEEIIFEIRENRIAAIDIGSMLDEAQESLRKAGDVLRDTRMANVCPPRISACATPSSASVPRVFWVRPPNRTTGPVSAMASPVGKCCRRMPNAVKRWMWPSRRVALSAGSSTTSTPRFPP